MFIIILLSYHLQINGLAFYLLNVDLLFILSLSSFSKRILFLRLILRLFYFTLELVCGKYIVGNEGPSFPIKGD